MRRCGGVWCEGGPCRGLGCFKCDYGICWQSTRLFLAFSQLDPWQVVERQANTDIVSFRRKKGYGGLKLERKWRQWHVRSLSSRGNQQDCFHVTMQRKHQDDGAPFGGSRDCGWKKPGSIQVDYHSMAWSSLTDNTTLSYLFLAFFQPYLWHVERQANRDNQFFVRRREGAGEYGYGGLKLGMRMTSMICP